MALDNSPLPAGFDIETATWEELQDNCLKFESKSPEFARCLERMDEFKKAAPPRDWAAHFKATAAAETPEMRRIRKAVQKRVRQMGGTIYGPEGI